MLRGRMTDPASSPVTLAFTDIEGSTHLWEAFPDAMQRAHTTHNEILVETFTEAGGAIHKDKGDGFIVLFTNPVAAVRAAASAQRRLGETVWPDDIGQVKVRMAINTGVVFPRDGDYYGPELNRTARLESIAHGGQIVVSETTRSLTAGLLDDLDFIDLGEHRLRGIDQIERVFQVQGEGLLDEFPPLRSVARGHQLPSFTTTFFGRDSERSEIVGLIREGARLVTLLGPGGIGKTRLAVEAARELEPGLSGRAYFADLAPLSSPDQVGVAIAEAVGVHPEGNADVLTLVADSISAPSLVVVDNFEHVVAGNAALGALISNTSELTILATSRQPLTLSGEQVYRLSPLDVSSNGRPSPAVELFYDRAAAHGVKLGEDDRPAVVSICKRLDGLPLAIELIAPRSRMMSAAELDQMLARSLNAMGTGAADMPERHRTIRNAIDWSLETLTDSPRSVFARLAALPAGATYPMLENVGVTDSSETLLDDLTTLVDNSLVNSVTGLPGGTRFRQLAPLREYGLELLRATDEYAATMDRLVDHYVAAAPEWGRRLQSDGRAEYELEADHANLLAALDWSVESRRVEEMARSQVEMWVYWFKGDRIAGAVDWVTRVRKTIRSASLDFLAGLLAFQTGDFDLAAEVMPAALHGFRNQGDTTGEALALTFGAVAVEDPAVGHQMLTEARQLANEVHSVVLVLISLFESSLDTQVGDLEAALRNRLEALEATERAGLPELIAWGKWNLGWTVMALGEAGRATQLWADTFDYMAGARYQEGVASTADGIALCELDAGRAGRAVQLLGAASATFERIGTVRWLEAAAMVEKASFELRRDLGDEAYEELYNEGHQLSFDQVIELTASSIEDLTSRPM